MKKSFTFVLAIAAVGFVGFSLLYTPTQAITSGGTATGTLDASDVGLVVSDSSISMTGLSFDSADVATIGGETRYLFESENEASGDKITFHENATNVKAYYYIDTTGFSAPSGAATSNNFNWALYKVVGNTYDVTNFNGISTGGAYGAYMSENITGSTVSPSSITAPTGVTPTGEGTLTFTVLISSDGNLWQEQSVTIYYVCDATAFYIDDDSDLSAGDYQSANNTGDEISILGNTFVLTTAAPTSNSQSFTFMMGWYQDETQNVVVGGTTMEFYMMLAIPFGPAGDYVATITITGAAYV
ncbi:MAG: hypothetical protein INQ03_20600 [Candidatus Heimdallarchaeota archaeon]|nr:hypothetical protein [Candidatus Heimdallarchaeota archaeon]